ncbi:MAG: hypothetical protein HY076_00940, partial [Candidatus Eisenbacteria bacterium]|nr:hypothetical protein [Candidatus Eisenbacteria bacterium]
MKPGFALALLVSLAVAAPAASAAPPTPESFLGFRVGADRKLADYEQIVRYFEALDQASDRLTLMKLGKTTLDKDLVMAVITSEANMRQLDHYRDIAKRLADPRGLDSTAAEKLIADGKVIVLVTCGIHASEIGSTQEAMEWAHTLITSEDPRVKRWLDDVILLLMPSINPDGTDMIVDYYRKYVGTPWEGGRLPWLYHHYAGHDNNRDWYMLTLPETRLVNRVLHHDWFPQVFLDEHQMGNNGPRIFVPPYADPGTPLVHPLKWRLNDLIGTAMALRLEQQRKSGVIYAYSFDAYWPGGTKNTACLKNVIGLLTEVASARIASPVYVDANELTGGRKGLPDYRMQMNFPNPWPGGWWRLRDIVDYELTAGNSLLETCSSYRAEFLRANYVMARDAVARGGSEAPFAYCIPPAQHDPVAAAEMVDLLREHGLEAKRANAEFRTADGRAFPAGTTVFLAAQPFRPFLVEMMERQRYPEVRVGTESKEIYRPYDVTAWTLPLLMGVESARVDKPFTADLAPVAVSSLKPGAIAGSGAAGFAIAADRNAAYAAVNRLLAKGVAVERATAAFADGANRFAPGAFIVPANAAAALEPIVRDLHVDAVRLAAAPAVARAPARAPRIGIYQSYSPSMDEGWTRMVLDRHDFKHTEINNAAVQAKDLKSKFDVIVIPDQDKNLIVDGKPRSEEGPAYFEPLPPEYSGGIGKDGVANLKAFVQAGGTLVCLSDACGLAIDEFNLPVRNVVARMRATDYSLPGTMVNLRVDPATPVGFGMPEDVVAY